MGEKKTIKYNHFIDDIPSMETEDDSSIDSDFNLDHKLF